jgi:D-beta-D-heptose 7-phosphate kinase/D-beta-D-heptose 1-phosphate adenosyltransferase
MARQLFELLTTSRRPKIMVLGDVMLDRYIHGRADRISPEAPIPVLTVTDREERLGGAGSVVMILAALEVDVIVATVTAEDIEGQRLRELLQRDRVDGGCILVSPDRTTTVKERLLGHTQSRHPQQIIRVDRENPEPITERTSDQLLAAIERRLDEVDVVLVSDYNKGICSDRLMAQLISECRKRQIPIVADPARGVNYRRYSGCTCITPNRSEAGLALGTHVETLAQIREAARRLLDFGIDCIVLTLDRDGIAWADQDGKVTLFPVQPRQVFDITGAGDAVLCGLGFGLAAGARWPTAIELANLAGGLEVQRLGVAPLTRSELLDELSDLGLSSRQKVVSIERLEEELEARRSAGQRIVMTNGCFDLLHPGHVASLQHARQQADCLVVGVNSDQSVQSLKGEGHPIINQQDRAEMLASMMSVDYVVIFDDASVTGLVARVAPDVLVKSAEYTTDQVVGHEIVENHGGRIALAPVKGSYSTSGLISKIQKLANPDETSDN